MPTYTDWVDLYHAAQGGAAVMVGERLTREVLAAGVLAPAGIIVGRKHSPALGFMEGLQFLTGVYDLAAIARVAPNADLSLFSYAAAYGPRSQVNGCDQLAHAVLELSEHPTSRRAVVDLRTTGEPLESGPCTTSLQFLLRDGALNTVVSMRSWDLWFGAPYDLVQFGLVAQAVATCLGAAPGFLHVTAGSCHVYTEHLGRVAWRSNRVFFAHPPLHMPDDPVMRLLALRAQAEAAVAAAPWEHSWPAHVAVNPVAVMRTVGEWTI